MSYVAGMIRVWGMFFCRMELRKTKTENLDVSFWTLRSHKRRGLSYASFGLRHKISCISTWGTKGHIYILSKNYLFGGADKKPSLNGHTIEFYNRRVKTLEPHTDK